MFSTPYTGLYNSKHVCMCTYKTIEYNCFRRLVISIVIKLGKTLNFGEGFSCVGLHFTFKNFQVQLLEKKIELE